jgi:transposase InsO family protein
VIEAMTPPQGQLSIERLCALAGVSRATYYRQWRDGAPRAEEIALRDVLQRLAIAHRHYGYRRLTALVQRDGWAVNHKRVLRLMRTDNLLCLRRRAFVPVTTDSRHGWRVVPNLARGIILTGLDQLWVADITYLRLLEEFAFLAVVLDAFSRRVIGWAVEVHLKATLALAALHMALAARRPRPGSLIHHSDRGVQYACGDYSALLSTHGIRTAMNTGISSRTGSRATSWSCDVRPYRAGLSRIRVDTPTRCRTLFSDEEGTGTCRERSAAGRERGTRPGGILRSSPWGEVS